MGACEGGTGARASKAAWMATSSAALPKSARPARVRRIRPRTRWIVLALAVALLLGGGYLWLRDSSLVGVEKVTITGATGSTSRAVEHAIENAATQMTTMDFDPAAIRAAVAPYPIVKSIEVRTKFPHGVDVIVHEHTPVATLVMGGKDVPVAADGTVLEGTIAKDVPPLATNRTPVGGTVTEAAVRDEIRVLAAATAAQRANVAHIQHGAHGVEVKLRDHEAVAYFGTGEEAADQWVALKRVLGDPASAGATYVDLRVPERPAAGGFSSGLGVESADGAVPDDGSDPAVDDGTDDGSGVSADDGTDDGSGDPSSYDDAGDGSGL